MADTVADTPRTPAGGNGGPRARVAAAIRDPVPWPEFLRLTETLEETGFEAVFLPEIAGREAFSSLAAVAGHTDRLRLGTGVITTVSRHTQTTAMAAATVQEISGGRFVLGLGTGQPAPGALSRLRATVIALRGLLAGGRVETEQGAVRLHAPPATPVPIWVAALGPRAVRLAGEVADGVLLNWCTPERVAQAHDEVREGARSVDRDPAEVTIAVYVRACVGLDDASALAALRAATGEYSAIPAYRRQFERSGLAAEAAVAAAAQRDRRVDAVPEALVRAVTLSGDVDRARARLRAYREAGADLPVVYPVPARDRASSLLGTLYALAPHPVLDP